jgi:hypothetical protein
METNINEVIEKFFNRTYAAGVRPENNALANKAWRHRRKKNGLNRVKGKADITYKELWHILNSHYEFAKKNPFENVNNRDVVNVLKLLVRLSNGKVNEKQFENGILATIVNPINRKEYGHNAEETVAEKGFDWPMKDTGSFVNQFKVWRIE